MNSLTQFPYFDKKTNKNKTHIRSIRTPQNLKIKTHPQPDQRRASRFQAD